MITEKYAAGSIAIDHWKWVEDDEREGDDRGKKMGWLKIISCFAVRMWDSYEEHKHKEVVG